MHLVGSMKYGAVEIEANIAPVAEHARIFISEKRL